MEQAYEILNPSVPELNLEQQIQYGLNDWCAEDADGHPYYGETAAQAEALRAAYN
jgi:hypothetical protein